MRWSFNLRRGAGAAAIAALAGLAGLCGTARAQDIKADVDYNTDISMTDPHPVTYNWNGKNDSIKDPGTDFYTFYYTGTINPDARVETGVKIQRIAVSNRDWIKNRDWLIAKLTLFYQIKNNQTPSAVQDLLSGRTPGAAAPPAAAGAPGAPGAAPAPVAAPDAAGPGFSPTSLPPTALAAGVAAPPGANGTPIFNPFAPGSGGFGAVGGGNTTFDSRAAAEWTFYYDQLVLWQYYCVRQLLAEPDDKLIDAQGPAGALAAALGQPGAAGAPGVGGPPGGAAPPGFSGGGGGGGRGGGFTGGPPGLAGAGGFGGGAPQMLQPNQVTAREQFSAVEDYNDPMRALHYREQFIQAAQKVDKDIHDRFATMINGIDQREADNKKYQAWLAEKRDEVAKFAENWQNVDTGKTMMVDKTLFLVTPKPIDVPPTQAINIVDKGRVTPQDLLNSDGTVKTPAR